MKFYSVHQEAEHESQHEPEHLKALLAEREAELLSIKTQLQQQIFKCKKAEAQKAELLIKEEAARQQAEAATRIKDEFLAMVAHELRSPLTNILAWAKLLTNYQFDAASFTKALKTIERNASNQVQVIEDLIDLLQLEQGKIRLNVSSVNLASVVGSAIDAGWLALEAKSIHIQAVITPVGKIKGDANRIQQIVWQLLANAIKFTPTGGHIEIRLESIDNYAQIQVVDTGIGISSDFLPYIFNCFSQGDTSNSRKHGGLGTGLSLVLHLVELHGGTITAESLGEGQGATFTVKLPLINTID